jgi:hypothetical protein
MSGFISKLCYATICVSTLAMFGCSSSDDGGGTAATVPPDAVTITEANAKEVVAQATIGGATLLDLVPVATNFTQAPSASDIIDPVVDKLIDIRKSPDLNIPVGEEIKIPCDSGSITGTGTETETSASGTISFNECVLGTVTVSGTVSFNASINLTTQDWVLNLSGNLSGTEGTMTTTLSGLVINETGNDGTSEFSINTYTFTLDYTGGGGFLVQLLAPIVGNELQTCPISPRSGVVQVVGADNTKAKGTISNDGTVTTVKIEYDDGSGTFIEVTEPPPGSPYPCSDFFV